MSVKKTQDNERLELHLKYLFDQAINFKDRVITIDSDIDGELFAWIDAALTELESHSRKAITVRIRSEGGDVYKALAIIGRLKKSKCQIVTEGYGCIMSAATMILACGDIRRISITSLL